MNKARPALRRIGMCGTCAILASAILASPQTSAFASAPQHITGQFSFPDNICGFAGTSFVSFIDNFKTYDDGSTTDTGRVYQEFTAASGRAITITFAGLESFAAPQPNDDGTTTYVATFDGSQTKVQAVNGGMLQQNAGRIRTIAVVAADGTLLSFTLQVLAGPNPNPGLPDCAVVGPYLAG